MGEVTQYFSVLKTQLWTNVQDLILIAILVAFITSVFIQAIKRSDETIFLKKSPNKSIIFILNIILNLIFSISTVLIFDGQGNFWNTLMYMTLIWILSFAFSILMYDYFLKYIFLILDIVEAKLQNIKIKSNGNQGNENGNKSS
jgi:hypothetical protein